MFTARRRQLSPSNKLTALDDDGDDDEAKLDFAYIEYHHVISSSIFHWDTPFNVTNGKYASNN